MADPKPIMALANGLMQGTLDRDAFLHGLTQEITRQLGCSRASFWTYGDSLRSRIDLQCLYDAGTQEWAEGMSLSEDDFAPYFAAMRADNLIIATDAHTHPATSCFKELYFEPLNIVSLLDVGITVAGAPFGLFCCENVTFQKAWSSADVEFLRQVGVLIGLALKRAAARQGAPA
ncbi:MAG: GAF domain-containing protein [Burkholderiaceae bacterium]|nr:GAF domain-containing protein [Burkholderiaceae bacterium]